MSNVCVIGIGTFAVKPALNWHHAWPVRVFTPPSLETFLLSMRFTGIDSDYNHKNSLPQRNNY